MATDKSLFAALAESVGPMAKLPNNGASYHTGEQIITHLNRVLGPENWSFRVLEIGEEPDSEECYCFGEITATINGGVVVKQDYGSQALKKSRQSGKYVSKWDDKKAATTDALKRCARLLGVGLDAWANERAPSWRPEIVDDGESEPRKANVDGSMIGWNQAVKGTRFADDDMAGKFVEWHTNGAHTTVRAYFEAATEEQAVALIKAISSRIAHEAKKAS